MSSHPGVSSHVDRFVGTGGDYTNEYQGGTWIPDVHRPYDVFQLEATNLDLEVRLVHGGADTSVNVGSSTVFDQHLDALGVDSELVYVDSTHRELRDPTTPGGRLVVDQIDALIHGRPSVFDGGGTDASLVFEVTAAEPRDPRPRGSAGRSTSVWSTTVTYRSGSRWSGSTPSTPTPRSLRS